MPKSHLDKWRRHHYGDNAPHSTRADMATNLVHCHRNPVLPTSHRPDKISLVASHHRCAACWIMLAVLVGGA